MIRLLSYAYDVPINPSPRLSGLPDWTVRECYDSEAKAPALLADRFKLVMRTQNKTMPVYQEILPVYTVDRIERPAANGSLRHFAQNAKSPDFRRGFSKFNWATSYSPTHSRVQYHRG